MSDLIERSAADLATAIAGRELTAVEVTRAHLDRIAAVDDSVHAFLHVDAEGALAQAERVDRGDITGPLAGVPLALKDIIVTRGVPTTAGSKILQGWVPPYQATIVERMLAAGIVVIGKTNCDEFAMGSSTEHSAYGATGNPWNLARTPGGSGGGSSASLAALEAPLAIGTDTGGSIRQPAALTATVGMKPTYGGVSRYGLIAFSSSLDQAGPCARTVLDAALLHGVIAGYDPRDSTSIDAPVPPVVEAARNGDVDGLRIGVVTELNGSVTPGGDRRAPGGYQPEVRAAFESVVEQLRGAGALVSEVSCPHFAYGLPAYYLIAPSEASSNLARFDGMRYGLRVGDDGVASAEDVMAATREAGFGPEVKRRIMLGTYALSAGYYDAYYGQAQKVRTLISRDFQAAFESVDVLVSPTTPTVAFELGSRLEDPLAMYVADLATIPSNLYGGPAISVPAGLGGETGLPVGFQVMAPVMADDRCYRVAAAVERLVGSGAELIAGSAPPL